MSDKPAADWNEQLDPTPTLPDQKQESAPPQEPETAEGDADTRESDTLRIVRAI